ncbi:hypothetical protein HPY1089_03805 [Helicobacter pylori]|nr:hypothetical protein HPY1089_03805 [Helicobacter pylori]KHL79912.1 hypothetical protein HPY1152_01440 [Helicobacter pylori]
MLKNGFLFYCFRSYFVVKRIFLSFIFLKGIGGNFTLDPKKQRVQKKGFKRNPLKKGSFTKS